MKQLLLLFIIAYLPIYTFGQSDYFTNKNSISTGIKLVKGGELMNSKFCQVEDGKNIIRYTPHEVNEFGFQDGRVYVSKDIKIADTLKRVFLERLNQGKITLYYYRAKGIKTFYIEKDNNLLVELPKQNKTKEAFSKQLLGITNDYPNISDDCNLVSYNKTSLSKFIERYNYKSNYKLKPFPHVRYGLTLGCGFTKLNNIPNTMNLNCIDFKYDSRFTFGIFIDHPISQSYFSLHSEINFSKYGYSYNTHKENLDIDFVANILSMEIPLLIRYTYPSDKIRPYINLGSIITLNIKNEARLYNTKIAENLIEINDLQSLTLIDKIHGGYSIGGGIEYKLNIKNSIFIEIRYNHQYGLKDSELSNLSEFRFLTGINF